MNKETAGDLGLTLQTGFVTKALLGLFGSDSRNFSLFGMIWLVLRFPPVASSQCYGAAIRDAGHWEHVSAGRPI
jgi:hypothetical protein